jgi:hypothetical protein
VNVAAASSTLDISASSSGATITTLNGIADRRVTLGGLAKDMQASGDSSVANPPARILTVFFPTVRFLI